MQYNVAQLLKEPTGSTRTVRLSEGEDGLGDLAERLAGRLELLRTHQGVLVRGQVDAQIPLACGRCLDGFVESSNLTVEEEFFPQIDVSTGRRLSAPEDAEGASIDANHILDMTEVLRQYLIGAQPIKPLCRLECAGLCPECGINRNTESCTCDGGPVDPRWDALAALLRES